MKNTFKILLLLIVLLTPAFLNADTVVNYDTAWTFVYDGGVAVTGIKAPISDIFYDVKVKEDGSVYCVGISADSANYTGTFLVKLDNKGELLWKNRYFRSGGGNSLVFAKNGDILIGGSRGTSPLLLRLDTLGNIKRTNWVYDSINKQRITISRSAVINCIRETKRGTIICAAGDQFPNNGGLNLNNYAAYLEFDSTLNLIRYREWDNRPGYEIGGFNIEETKGGEYLLSGNKAVFYLDTSGAPKWQKSYTYQLEGTGSQVANIFRAKVLRDNTPVIIGQVYESDCWVNYQRYYYDAWWTPVRYTDGSIVSWDTAGIEAGSDVIYDFAQLESGNLVFVGNPQYVGGIRMLWVFVTDSSGKNILWESMYAGPDSLNITPYSVAATPDSGFTVVGSGSPVNNPNAIAMHFIPVLPVFSSPVTSPKKILTVVRTTITNSRVLFTCTGGSVNSVLAIYNITGKKITSLRSSTSVSGNSSFVLDRSRISNGVYSYRLSSGDGLLVNAGKFVLK